MKNLLKKLILSLVIASLVGCSDFGSKKWRLDNKKLTADEVSMLNDAIKFKKHINENKAWEKLSGKDWAYLLVFFPEETKKCEKSNAWQKFSNVDWANLLSNDISFKEKFEKVFAGKRNPYEIFTARDWITILEKQPDFMEVAENSKVWENFTSQDWLLVIQSKNSIIKSKCDEKNGWSKLSFSDWVKLLSKDNIYSKQFFNAQISHNLTADNWKDLIKIDKSFMQKCNKSGALKKFTPVDLLEIIDKNNVDLISNELDWKKFNLKNSKLRGNNEKLLNTVTQKPYIFEKIPEEVIESMNSQCWVKILLADPTLAKYANKYDIWKDFVFSDWNNLLSANRDFTEIFLRNEPWKKWSDSNKKRLWNEIAKGNPALEDLKNKNSMSLKEWINAINKDPSLFAEFEKFSKPQDLPARSWVSMLIKNPSLSKYAEKYNITFFGNDFVTMVRKQPKLACLAKNRNQMAYLADGSWNILLSIAPELHTFYLKTKRNETDWVKALINDYENEIRDFFIIAEYDYIYVKNWDCLLKHQPKFVEHYNNPEIIKILRCKWRDERGVDGIAAILFSLIRDKKDKNAFNMLLNIANFQADNPYDYECFYIKSRINYVYYYLARCYKDGLCVEKDNQKANSFYEQMNSFGKIELDENGINKKVENHYKEVGNELYQWTGFNFRVIVL